MGGSTFASGESVLFAGMTGTAWGDLQVADPGAARLIDYQVRSGGVQLTLVGLLSLSVTLFGLRRGQRWAWLAMWLWPLWFASIVITLLLTPRVANAGIPVPVISGTVFLVLTVALQVLSFRKYARVRARR
jgi:hypothetical protein